MKSGFAAVHLSANPVFHARSKHFKTHYHYVREKVALGSLIVKHVPSSHQLADIFTKSLPKTAFRSLRFKLGVVLPPTPSLRGAISKKPLAAAESLKPASKQNNIRLVNGPNKSSVGLWKVKTLQQRETPSQQHVAPAKSEQVELKNKFEPLLLLATN